jgi:hypothetical protein
MSMAFCRCVMCFSSSFLLREVKRQVVVVVVVVVCPALSLSLSLFSPTTRGNEENASLIMSERIRVDQRCHHPYTDVSIILSVSLCVML